MIKTQVMCPNCRAILEIGALNTGPDQLYRSLWTLELSARAQNALEHVLGRDARIGDLCTLTMAEVMRFKNLGRKTLKELDELLQEQGLSFSMKVHNWHPQVRLCRSECDGHWGLHGHPITEGTGK